MRHWALALPPFLLLVPSTAVATPSRLHLVYSAPPDCPDALMFGEQLHERTDVRFVDAPEGRTLIVHIEAREPKTNERSTGLFVGRLTLGDDDPTRGRDVVGASCNDVVSGLALIASIALKSDEPDNDEGGKKSPPAPSSAPADHQTIPPPLNKPPLDRDALRASDREASGRDASARQGPWSVFAGVNGELAFGISPRLAFALPVYLEAARAITDTSDSHSFALGARLRFVRAIVETDATFTWTVGGLDLCPLVWSTWKLRIQLCERTEAGTLEATGLNVQATRSAMRPWIDVGASAGASVMIGPIFFALEAALAVPIIRDRFFVEPDTTVFKVPASGWTTSLGVGAHIW